MVTFKVCPLASPRGENRHAVREGRFFRASRKGKENRNVAHFKVISTQQLDPDYRANTRETH